ncbi:MAG: ABC transporter ATP-binding protein [Polyangiales bacterium]
MRTDEQRTSRTNHHPRGAAKWYDSVTALGPTDIQLDAGVWALLGPNGAGKTTFLELIAGQLKPSLGACSIGGEPCFANSDVLRRIGYAPSSDRLYDELTVNEFVFGMAKLSGLDDLHATERVDVMMQAFDLSGDQDRHIGDLSRGIRQRVKLAQAQVHDPDILLLDEPLSGTDPRSRFAIIENIRSFAKRGKLVIVSTHVLHEAEALTDNIILIAKGQLIATGDRKQIRELLDEHPHQIRIESSDARAIASALMNEPSIVATRLIAPNVLQVDAQSVEKAFDAIARSIVSGGLALDEMYSADDNLEAVFNYLLASRGPRPS